jgi:phosphatidate cytidylyltransferase
VDDGAQWLMLALIVTFAADTAAMLAGITFGRHKLIPRISPNKSWEGLIGGLIGAAIAALVVDTAFDLEIASGMAVVLGIVMAITGTLGDLGVSAFKRHAGVKDSGFLVPGHGGVLDRLDSLLPTIVIVYWVSEWSAT